MRFALQADMRRQAAGRRRARHQVRVSFSGVDGAGKSSQIEAIMAELGREQRSAQVAWLPYHFWPTQAKAVVPTRLLDRLHTKNPKRSEVEVVKPSPEHGDTTRQRGDREKAGGRRARTGATAVAATVAALSAGMSLRQRMPSDDADVLVLDRYLLDSLVKLRYAFPGVSQPWLSRVIRSVAPRADLELLVRVEPEVAYARKPAQWDVRQLTAHAGLYDELASSAPTVVTLDGSLPPEDLAREVWARVRPLLDGR